MSPAVIDDGGGTDRGEHGATTSARVGFGEREGPARDAEIEERIAWIRQRLVEVHSIDRELIEAHYGRGQTVVSAAAASGVKPGAATGRLTRVIAGLRTKAKELFNDEA